MGEVASVDKVSSELAFDLASGLWERDIVLQKHEVDESQWERLRKNPQFREKLREAFDYWNGKNGADRRIRAKAKMMLEESLPVLHKIANAEDNSAGARLSAIERMEQLSGMKEEQPGGGATGPVFAISINIGGETVSISGQPGTRQSTVEGEVEDAETVE